MGCCLSTGNGAPSSASASSPRRDQNVAVGGNGKQLTLRSSSSSSSSVKASENRAPPEEESVKEVLSETQKWKPAIAKLEHEKSPREPEFEKFTEGKKIDKVVPLKKEEEISEVSEVCSLSETMSTTTITDRRDEVDEIRQTVNASPAKTWKKRSFSGDLGKERTVGKSPTKRSERSPGRRNTGSMRLIQSRDQLGQNQTMGYRGIRNSPHRQEPGENSGRRSRSPATRTDNGAIRSVVGRSPSARRTNQSPARVRTASSDSICRRKEPPSTEGKWPSAAANESLENPLVSLECFIFL